MSVSSLLFDDLRAIVWTSCFSKTFCIEIESLCHLKSKLISTAEPPKSALSRGSPFSSVKVPKNGAFLPFLGFVDNTLALHFEIT